MNIQDRANACIAQGALTNSKRASTFVEGVYPTHLSHGKGCYVWDTAGKKYFDFICALGSNILGYAQEDVNKAICTQVQKGATLSLGTPLELQVAEKLKNIFPFVDRMKFLKTGTEACSAAIRIARTYTERSLVLSEGYHGWSDIFVSQTAPALGVKDKFRIVQVSQNTDFSTLPETPAAIILEPIMTDWSSSRVKWLRLVREYCTRHGIILIFDEVITGFRFPRFAVSNYLEIEPDIILLGKAIANGMPLSVVGGKKEVMNCDEYFVSSTFAGETLSLAAADKVIDLMRGQFKLETLWQRGEEWIKAFNSIWSEMIRIEGYGTRGRFEGDPLVKALFFQESVDSGMLFGPSWFYNFPLSEKADITLPAVRDVICKIKMGSVKLRGKMPQSPFAEKMRQRQQ